MDNIVSKVETKIGPLAVWQWGVIGAGGIFLLRRLRGGSSGVSTVTLTPSSGGGIGTQATRTGDLSNFLSGLNALYPDLSFTLPDGTTFTGSGGTPLPTLPVGGSSGSSGGSGRNPPPTPGQTPGQTPTGPSPTPSGRGGGVLPGATPTNPFPRRWVPPSVGPTVPLPTRPPANPVTPPLPIRPRNPQNVVL